MADNRKLTAGLLKMPEAQRQELARMGEEYKRFQEADYLRKMGEQGMGLAKSVARGVPQMATGLVDLAAMPFEAAGVLQPGQAVGSTKWLESKGYLPEQQEGFLNQTAELLSGGFDPSDLVTKGAPLLMGVGKTVWHGSPHTFDKFDLSKIGTGEGAQSYGHGLYLAEAKPTAENYRESLTMNERIGGFKPGKAMVDNIPAKDISQDVWEVADQMASRNMNVDEYINHLKNKIVSSGENVNRGSVFNELLEQANKVKPELTGKIVRWEEPGALYKVDLPDEQIAKMLDWDKPLSEQSETIQNALSQYSKNYENPEKALRDFLGTDYAKEFPDVRDVKWAKEILNNPDYDVAIDGKAWLDSQMRAGVGSSFYNLLGSKNAGQIYERMAQDLGGANLASQKLYEAGIPGIQYLDQASRGAGEGTRNYVVFSDEIPQILERNGQPIAQALRDYRGSHTAPGPDFGAQLHDLTGGGQMYPDDVYSPNAYRFYGHGGPDVALDKETTKIAQSFRGKPDEMVDIYRAVPNEADITAINAGDWVTINPNYAKQHGESQLGGDYKILQQKVPAKTIWTNADSIHEYGYWPE